MRLLTQPPPHADAIAGIRSLRGSAPPLASDDMTAGNTCLDGLLPWEGPLSPPNGACWHGRRRRAATFKVPVIQRREDWLLGCCRRSLLSWDRYTLPGLQCQAICRHDRSDGVLSYVCQLDASWSDSVRTFSCQSSVAWPRRLYLAALVVRQAENDGKRFEEIGSVGQFLQN